MSVMHKTKFDPLFPQDEGSLKIVRAEKWTTTIDYIVQSISYPKLAKGFQYQ